MKVKTLLCILLVFPVLLSTLVACGGAGAMISESEKINLLPYELEFGMKYDDAKSVLKNIPPISKDAYGTGYTTDKYYIDFSDYADYYRIDSDTLYKDMSNGKGIVSDPICLFSFNEDKELYSYTVFTTIRGLDGESAAEYLYNAYLDYFSEQFKTEPKLDESEDMLSVHYETEDISVFVILLVDGTDFYVFFVIDSYEHSDTGTHSFANRETMTEATEHPPTTKPVETTVPETTVPETTVPETTEAVQLIPTNPVPYYANISGSVGIYQRPDYNSPFVCYVGADGIYTIMEEAFDSQGNLWGRLKSGLGWVVLN